MECSRRARWPVAPAGGKTRNASAAVLSALLIAFGCGDSEGSDAANTAGAGKGGTDAGSTAGGGGTTGSSGDSSGGEATGGSGGASADGAVGTAGASGSGGAEASGGTAGASVDAGSDAGGHDSGVPCGAVTCGTDQYCGVDFGPSCQQAGRSCKNLPERCNGVAACPCVCLQCTAFQGVINCGCG